MRHQYSVGGRVGAAVVAPATADRSPVVRPPRLNFAGVCVWCGEPGCESPQCLEAHARSRWMVCDECGGLGLCGCDCDCVFGVVEAPAGDQVSGRVPLGEVTVRVFDRGPEPEFQT